MTNLQLTSFSTVKKVESIPLSLLLFNILNKSSRTEEIQQSWILVIKLLEKCIEDLIGELVGSFIS